MVAALVAIGDGRIVRRTDVVAFTTRLGALGLLVAAAIVPMLSNVGPVVLVLGPGLGLHALDAGVIVIAIPLTVVLLRAAERRNR